jgi:hypothetical protein
MTHAPKSSVRTEAKLPQKLPMGVRMPSIMYACFMLFVFRKKGMFPFLGYNVLSERNASFPWL